MHRQEEVSLLFDVGTNGEVVLGNRDWRIACSSSAGPAFEGGGVGCGMRAYPGAVEWGGGRWSGGDGRGAFAAPESSTFARSCSGPGSWTGRDDSPPAPGRGGAPRGGGAGATGGPRGRAPR